MGDPIMDLADQFADHERKDEERFGTVAKKVDDVSNVVRAEVGKVVEAITGNTLVGGLRERVAKLEDAERDRKWALRLLWSAVLAEAVALVFKVFTIKGAMTP